MIVEHRECSISA